MLQRLNMRRSTSCESFTVPLWLYCDNAASERFERRKQCECKLLRVAVINGAVTFD